jgi:hypothetical protein
LVALPFVDKTFNDDDYCLKLLMEMSFTDNLASAYPDTEFSDQLLGKLGENWHNQEYLSFLL